MPDFQPAKTGEPFRPKAFEWNAMLEAGRRVASVGGATPAGNLGTLDTQPNVIRVKNTSGGDRGRYAVLSLGAARWTLDADKNITGTVFAAAAYASESWPCVLQQPLKSNAIGFAVVIGPTLVQIGSGGSASKKYGTPSASYNLTPGEAGPVYLPGGSASSGVVLGVVGASKSADAIIDLRLSGTALQYTKDGTNWTTWHTGTTCP